MIRNPMFPVTEGEVVRVVSVTAIPVTESPQAGEGHLGIGPGSTTTQVCPFFQDSLGNALRLAPLKTLQAAAPTVNDDRTRGFVEGSLWLDTTTDRSYVCMDSATGAAIWRLILVTPIGGGSTIQSGMAALAAAAETVAVTFPSAFSAAPVVTAVLERGGSPVQSVQIEAVTAAGFTARRTSASGTAIVHWIATGN